MKKICLLLVLFAFSKNIFAQPDWFRGAELTAMTSSPGKLHITLQVFYDTEQTSTPAMEKVLVLESKVMRTPDMVELKKESESIYNKYPPVGAGHKSAVISCIYSGDFEVGLFRTSYDVTWAYAGLKDTFNNIDLKSDDALALVVHIGDPVTTIKNNIPMLDHLPAPKVSDKAKTGYPVNVTDKDETDKVEVMLSTPLVFSAPSQTFRQQGSILTERNPLNKIKYKKGFSEEMPGAKSLSYDQEKKEFSFDHPPFGKYLFAITISDYRNQKILSEHQAVFIIESVF